VSCPLSNLVLGGSRRIEDLTTSYAGLRKAGVLVLRDEVRSVDPATRKVSFGEHPDQTFDRIVMSPGIDFNFAAIEGLDAEAQKTILHAWKAGPQTVALRQQLEAMPDGGVYLLSIPRAPYRCPPGPYERVCQVAHYFRTHKPRSKIVVLDANPDIQSKKGLFLKEWNGQYKGLIDYQPDMQVTEVDARNRVAITELGDKVKADVLNIVPPHGAAEIAHKSGLVNANNRWCMVDWISLESTVAKGVHVLGDATLAAPAMPKSGHMANQHGKAAAAAIVEAFNGRTPQPQMMANTCYSFVDDKRVVHVASVHRWSPEKRTIEPVAGAGGLSAEATELEGEYANAWARNIWNDMLT
jgi:sulfite dehydrogenase